MSQSASVCSPFPVSHSRALLATCGCSRPGAPSHSSRKATHFGSDSRKKKCSDVFNTGFVPESVEYGLMSCIGVLTMLQTSQASAYWSLAWQFGHSPLMYRSGRNICFTGS